MATFTPPATNSIPAVLPEGSPGQSRLQYASNRHLRSRPEGINVYILSDNSVTENDPDGTAVVWTPGDRNGESVNAIWVTRAFYGGRTYTDVTSAESTLLTNAGYTVT